MPQQVFFRAFTAACFGAAAKLCDGARSARKFFPAGQNGNEAAVIMLGAASKILKLSAVYGTSFRRRCLSSEIYAAGIILKFPYQNTALLHLFLPSGKNPARQRGAGKAQAANAFIKEEEKKNAAFRPLFCAVSIARRGKAKQDKAASRGE